MPKTELLFIVGFLGSGKTTLLKYLLESYSDKNIGIVLNDFGSISIDEELISVQGNKKHGIYNGSIFCSCRSDQLIETILEMAEEHLDMILVEASGLANPGSMQSILDIIFDKAPVPIDYIGSIGVVDATSVHKLEHTNIVKNQIMHSDIILLNKVDQADNETRNHAIDLIHQIQTTVPIIQTTYAKFDIDQLSNMSIKHHKKRNYGITLNDQSYTLDISNLPFEQVLEICEQVKDTIYRIKGFYNNGKTSIYIDCVDGTCTTQTISIGVPSSLVFLTSDAIDLESIVTTAYSNLLNH